MPPHLPADRALALAASLPTLRTLFRDVHFCGSTTTMPIRMAVASGVTGSLADMVLKLTCKRCGAGPERVTLLDRADGLNPRYGPPQWRVVLIDRAPEARTDPPPAPPPHRPAPE